METLEQQLAAMIEFHGMPTILDTLIFICEEKQIKGKQGASWDAALHEVYKKMTVGS